METTDPGFLAAALGVVVATILMAGAAAAETALERANGVRIRSLAAQGDPRARAIAGAVGQTAGFLGSLTTGRVLSSAVLLTLLAFIGIEYGDQSTSDVIWYVAIGGMWMTLVQVTVGLIAARRPEQTALKLSRMVLWYGRVFLVPAFLFGLPARLIARSVLAVAPNRQQDLLSLVEEEEASGGVEEEERKMIQRIIALEDKTVREIMVPRIDIVAVAIDDTPEMVIDLINERGYSRVPVYRERIDDVVGIVYAKDLLRVVANGGRERPLKDLLRPAEFVPESLKLDNLLAQMRILKTHLALVADEYGGVAGLVTIEDLLEEIVGEIEDEYDVAPPEREVISDDEVVLDARESTDVLTELFGVDAESEDFDTVGGYVIHHLGRLPSVGDQVTTGGLTLRVLSMSGRRIRRLRITRQTAPDPNGGK